MTDTLILNRRRSVSIWYQENEKENWEKTKHFVSISTYLTYLITSRLADSPSNYTGHYPINFIHSRWAKASELKNVYDVPANLMCDLVPPTKQIGQVSEAFFKATGLPTSIKFFASGSDKSCETLGVGALSKDIGSISYGTASTIEVSNRKYIEPEAFLPAYPSCVPDLYNMEVQIYRGYWMLSWFTKEFAQVDYSEAEIQKMSVEEILNAKMMAIPPGSNGLILQPYWGPGLKRPLSKGAIVGFSDVHTKAHLYRAIIEGIAYALREALIGIEKNQHKRVKKLMISGGGSQSDAICQITSDVFGLVVERTQTYETSSLGGAICVFMAVNQFASFKDAIDAMVHVTTVFSPDSKNHAIYEDLFKECYIKLYPKLHRIYKSLKHINKEMK
jgi:sugar (pentulose or hexulose) kinase